jgi:hypothetical protein
MAHETPQQNAQPTFITMTPQQLQDLMKGLAGAQSTANAEQQAKLIVDAVTLAVGEMRKPSPDEQKKQEAERERLLNARKQAAEAGKMEVAMIKQQQTQCQHQKPNGEHTFRGIVHSNGWAVIKCQRCYIQFTVRPLPDHIQNGLNLGDIRGLTVEHLKAWEANSQKIDAQIRKSQEAMAGMSTQFASMAPAASGL